MTRYARAGKGATHQRVAKDPTPWNDMKPSKPQRVRGNDNGEEKKFSGKSRKKERFSKGKGNFSKSNNAERTVSSEVDVNKTSSTSADPPDHQSNQQRNFKKSKNENIRGFGQSKSVKILGQFWVPLEDGKRLKSLLRKLKAQGLPRKEILEKLKNERRKAEKASKRQRDKTCFQCRQFGHVLSDCPNLRKAIAGEDLSVGNDEEPSEEQGLICFKCGSTEHTSRNCRRKGENFEFAKCFICSGSGHIARQCPKNSNGIYPSGGSCSECGATTHLKKDCPDFVGMEDNNSAKGEDDAVTTLRMSDPFSSTEYEPVYNHEDEDNAKKLSVEQDASNISDSKNVPIKQKTVKKKGKRKSKLIDDDGPPTFDFDGGNDTANIAAKKPLFANKKRKIVKF